MPNERFNDPEKLFVQPLRFPIFAHYLRPPMLRLFIAFFCLAYCSSIAQDYDTVLLTINDEEITVNEFERVYEKNLNLVQDEELRDPKSYLDLFIDYKLKVQKAYDLGLDENQDYQKELASYRKELVKSHLTDVAVTEALVKEAYERTKEERKGRHILIRVSPAATAADTIAAYNKIMTARDRILSGEDFEKVAREVSEDPSAKKNGGDLGFFKAFKMVYPFESAAYDTEIGAVSLPFRTRFGYHLVQPTETRTSKGKVRVAHIMIGLNQKDSLIDPEKRIKEVYAKLQSGSSFKTLAQNYSDDKNSARKGGELAILEEGQLSTPVFEEKAFGLTEVGSYTQPFKTKFGWHIVKLLDKMPVGTYEDMKANLQQRITRDARAQVIDNKLNEKLRKRYAVYDLSNLKSFFNKKLPDNYRESQVNTDSDVMDKLALKIGEKILTYGDYAKHLARLAKTTPYPSKEAFIEDQVEKYTNKEIRSYYESQLESIDPSFKAVLKEYREGLLLFELLESEIWEKAKSDSLGLKDFYDKNKDKFMSEPMAEVIVITMPNETETRKVIKYLERDYDLEKLKNKLNRLSENIIVIKRTESIKDLPKPVDTAVNSISTVNNALTSVLYKIVNVITAQPRPLHEVKGLVTSAYQKEIEKNFVQDLRRNAQIDINEDVMTDVEKKYND